MKKLKLQELNRLTIEEFKKTEKNAIVVVLDNVRSLNNIGSVFRSSDSFLIKQICLCGISATPPNKDIYKTALGAEQSVEWTYYENTLDCINDLKSKKYTVISVEQTDGSIILNNFQVKKSEKYALVFGHEVHGVNQDIVDKSDYCVEIPQFGTKHSLNISVCAGIVLWEFSKKFNL